MPAPVKTIQRKRPLIVSVMCYKGYAWGLIGLMFVFSHPIKNLGRWYPALFGIIVALRFISYVGVSHMKKWGVHLLILSFCADLCLRIAVDMFSIINCITGALSLSVFFSYYNKMDDNL